MTIVIQQLQSFITRTQQLSQYETNPYLADIFARENLVIGILDEAPGLFLVDQSVLDKRVLTTITSTGSGMSDLELYTQKLESLATTLPQTIT